MRLKFWLQAKPDDPLPIEPMWYVRRYRGGNLLISDQLTVAEVHSVILDGRVHVFDEASEDCQSWEPIHQVPELIPESILQPFDEMLIE
jgi:hypothetical protein